MSYLVFNPKISSQKPNTIRNKAIECPFCDRKNLANIIKEEGDILLVENKYPTIEEAEMFVVIETKTCKRDVFNYTIDEYEKILSFIINEWLNLKHSGQYVDVIAHKNYGPLSGGSVKHEHMQIVGFHETTVYEQLSVRNLEGIEVLNDEVTITISDLPINNFLEFNLEFNLNRIDKLAEYLQLVIKYLKSNYKLAEFSYNLFFYEFNNRLFVKVLSRYAMSPLYLGFDLKQCYKNRDLFEFKEDLIKYIDENSDQ